MDAKELEEFYLDSATIPLVLNLPEGVTEDEITVTHRPIDLALWDELEAARLEAQNETPIAVRHLLLVGARIKDLTRGGVPVEFAADFWAGLKPSLRERIVEAVGRNVPGEVRYAAALRRMQQEGEQDVEGNGQQT